MMIGIPMMMSARAMVIVMMMVIEMNIVMVAGMAIVAVSLVGMDLDVGVAMAWTPRRGERFEFDSFLVTPRKTRAQH